MSSLAVLAGCGEPGAPQPPSLNLPQPVRDLAATRTANTVHLAWNTTDRTTDHTSVVGIVRIRICRVEGTGPCELVTDLPLKLGTASQFDDTLPTEELQGAPQLLTYYVELLNHARKSAGRSNAAYSASGQAIPDLSGFSVSLLPEGVELHWHPADWPNASAPVDRLVRITRLDENPPKAKPASVATGKSILAAPQSQQPVLQTLEVAAQPGTKPGRALDRNAHFGETYRYQAEYVERRTLDGHTIESVGPMSQPAVIFAEDTFPPAVPRQLDAVADPATHAIDLSWSPDSEPDLVGYIVYRSDAVGSGWEKPHRISGDAPLITPAFHDANLAPGENYAYTVTAIDQSGNESKPSDQAIETAAP